MTKTLQLTDEQYAALQAGESITIEPPKPEVWEPERGDWAVFGDCKISMSSSVLTYAKAGAERPTKKQAEAFAIRRWNRDRIDAYVDQYSEEGEVRDWGVYYSETYLAWQRYKPDAVVLGRICMPYRVAKQLAADLNSGRVVLKEEK